MTGSIVLSNIILTNVVNPKPFIQLTTSNAVAFNFNSVTMTGFTSASPACFSSADGFELFVTFTLSLNWYANRRGFLFFLNINMTEIEKLLLKLLEIKEKLADSKAILKHYKIQSDRLTQLKQAKKELQEQIREETDRIEDEFYQEADFEKAKNDELTYKNQIKELSSELKQTMAQVDTSEQLSTYNYNIKGEKVKMQVERVAKVYLNGKEEK